MKSCTGWILETIIKCIDSQIDRYIDLQRYIIDDYRIDEDKDI